MKKIISSNNALVVILIVLSILIVGLFIGVIVINNTSTDSSEQKEEEVLTDVEIIKKAASDEMYVLTEKIAEEYNSGNKDEAVSMYKSEMDEALSNEDYDKFFDLLSSVSVVMTDNGDCAQLIVLLDSLDANRIPANWRINFYGTAAGACKNCGYEDKQRMYENLTQELYNNEGVEYYED